MSDPQARDPAAPDPGARDPRAATFAGVVLAAGTGTRFGGGKVRALLDGRPLVAHVLAAARAAGIERLVLVLGRDAAAVRVALLTADRAALDGVLLVVNPAPERGLATSLRAGLAGATAIPAPAGVVVLLGDQPRVQPGALAALGSAAAAAPTGTLAVVPAYDGAASAPNPALLLAPAWPLAAGLEGDRGLGPLLAARADLVVRVPFPGDNPDVDSPADLEALQRSNP